MITIEPIMQKNQTDSLTRLFQSEYFTAEMLITYLNKYVRNEGIMNYLSNKLFECDNQQLEYLYPQLCYLCIKYDLPSVQRFLQLKSSQNIRLFQKIIWIFESFGQVSHNKKQQKFKVEKIIKSIEQSMVNGYIQDQNQQARMNYYNEFQVFTNSLLKISQSLVKMDPKDRNQILQQKIGELNKWMNKSRQFYQFYRSENQYQNSLFEGFIMPFGEESYQIVNIIKNQSKCFSTKKRVPFKIVFETINPDDLLIHQKNFQRKYIDFSLKKCQSLPQIKKQKLNLKKRKSLENCFNEQNKSLNFIENNIDLYPQFKEQLYKARDKMIIMETFKKNYVNYDNIWESNQYHKSKQKSPWGHFPSYQQKQIIFKSNDDLRQELVVMQIIKKIHQIFVSSQNPIFIQPYDISVISQDSGIIEYIANTYSIDSLKRIFTQKSLIQIFQIIFKDNLEESVKNFTQSLAGYSLLQYLLQIKDRQQLIV